MTPKKTEVEVGGEQI